MSKQDNSSKEQWVKESLIESNEKTNDSFSDNYDKNVTHGGDKESQFPDDESVNQTDKKPSEETTIKTEDKKAKKSGYAALIFIIVLIVIGGVAYIAYEKYSLNKQQQETTIAIEQTRSNIEGNIATLEEKLVDVVDSQIKPLMNSVEQLKLALNTLELSLNKNRANIEQQQLMLTGLSENEKFNSELVNVVSKSSQANKESIDSLRMVLGALDQNLKNIEKTNLPSFSISPNAAQETVDLKTIEGYKFFSVDIWGAEKVAVFTKDTAFQKVKEGEFIEGYYVESINAVSGEVELTKDKLKYLVTIR
ncbi:MAG: hypothetical protein P8I03_15145 [Thalassotalea sp.]|nr:hypothetical protein [Thalassotalea sp.]